MLADGASRFLRAPTLLGSQKGKSGRALILTPVLTGSSVALLQPAKQIILRLGSYSGDGNPSPSWFQALATCLSAELGGGLWVGEPRGSVV